VNIERLTTMVNDIANYFHAEPDHRLAVDGISEHLKKYWEPRMRRQIIAYVNSDDSNELSPLAREGVLRLAELDASKA
jgi:formate dehydrogenase subunit delta